jgi:hypothetical protein
VPTAAACLLNVKQVHLRQNALTALGSSVAAGLQFVASPCAIV